MKYCLKNLTSDVAPLEGRKDLNNQLGSENLKLTWEGSFCSVAGEYLNSTGKGEQSLRLQGRLYPQDDKNSYSGWIELETMPGQALPIPADLYLVGTRPLPRPNITCISRHPLYQDYLVAATSDPSLLLLDASLKENLKILYEVKLTAEIISLVCCGKHLLGLEESLQSLELIEVISDSGPFPGFLPAAHLPLFAPLTALAENDGCSAWGLTAEGALYCLQVHNSPLSSQTRVKDQKPLKPVGCLTCPSLTVAQYLKFAFRVLNHRGSIKQRISGWKKLFNGLAFDGKHFWVSCQPQLVKSHRLLFLYSQDGSPVQTYFLPPEVSISSLNYRHNQLMVLDLKHQQFHLLYPADYMQPQSSLPLSTRHPGYLGSGTELTAGIHDLCLLYVGDEGNYQVHRYDLDKLLPLIGYIDPAGNIQDFFMDGFLILAQYSPLLNGRTFGVDLPGSPSLKEDWLALFNEYYHPHSNLNALDEGAEQIRQILHKPSINPLKVVLTIPTPDPRSVNWDGQGFSLAREANRVEVTQWAAEELINRWHQANFHNLKLAGFYYMTEQGLYDDPVLHLLPDLCHRFGLRSFAIPGIASSCMTEFVRAGFDCIALQSSHAFWQPDQRPWFYLLKNAGRIARDFGMGMEVELPYDILEPHGRQKLRDYLEFAKIQGWAGAFKAYFQSYNLIKTLAESEIPECRQLYDELYLISRLSRKPQPVHINIARAAIPLDGQIKWFQNEHPVFLRLNSEGWQGTFQLTAITNDQ